MFNRPCGGSASHAFGAVCTVCTSEGTVCYAHFFGRTSDQGQFMNERDPPREVAGFRGRV
jgi:hypothetical protein